MNKHIGVLALQGDVREHVSAYQRLGATVSLVRNASELERIDGLVIPGGESTTIGKLAQIFGLFDPISAAIKSGLPVFGTCAGLIMLADRLVDGAVNQATFGGLDVTVQRNAFGNQLDSFEVDLQVVGIPNPVHAAFIRAPLIVESGSAQVISTLADGRVVAVRRNNLLGISFHPEVTGDDSVHELFLREFVK